jgi:hypothetical protein
MTNTALDLLKNVEVDGTIARNSEYDILLQHNDPSLLYYKFNKKIQRRKPDNIFITLNTARILHNVENASWTTIVTKYAYRSQEKTCPRLDWGDALCSVEHKREKGEVSQKRGRKLKEGDLLLLGDLSRFSLKRSRQKRGIDIVLEADEVPSGASTYCIDGSPSILMLDLVERQKSNRGVVRTTGSSHAMAESIKALQVQTPPQEDNTDWERSVAIQSAEYGLGRLCCSYDMVHAFTLMVVGTECLPR